MGMLTGIRVITLLELIFWFIRLISRRCFKSHETKYEFPAGRSNSGRQRIDALEKRNAEMEKRNAEMEKRNEAMEKEIKRKFSVMEKILSHGVRPGRKVIRHSNWPSLKKK